jgi:hypothetical protein
LIGRPYRRAVFLDEGFDEGTGYVQIEDRLSEIENQGLKERKQLN